MRGECLPRLTALGIAYHDAVALRRIAMTLHRWHELECGDGNSYGSWAIEREPDWLGTATEHGAKIHRRKRHEWVILDQNNTPLWEGVFGSENEAAEAYCEHHKLEPYSDGDPFVVHHHYAHGNGKDTVTRTRIADREAGAKKRLAATMAKYPHLAAYIQGDPRGASLYILRPGDVPEGKEAEAYYSRGIAVYA